MFINKTLFLSILITFLSVGCGKSHESTPQKNDDTNASKSNNDQNQTIKPIDANKTTKPIDKNETIATVPPKESNQTSLAPFKTGTKYSKFPFDDANTSRGIARSYTKSSDIITDNITTLQWQDQEAPLKNWQDAMTYCQTLTIAGVADWRVPSMKELLTIVDLSQVPTIDLIFSHRQSAKYWTATEYPIQSEKYAYYVNFENGTSYEYAQRDPYEKIHTYAVRCVRGEPYHKNPSFEKDDAKHVIIDKLHHLMWTNDEATSKQRGDLNSSMHYCENITLGGYHDWALPNINELYTIADRTHFDSAIHSAFDFVPTFGEKEKNYHIGNYWSTSHFTTDTANNIHYYRTLNIQNGASRECRHYFTDSMYTRCVRVIK